MQRLHLHDLPDDILIAIFSLGDIEGLLALRLVSTRFYAVVDTYCKSIAPAAARVSFGDPDSGSGSDTLLRVKEDGYSIRWVRNLIPRYLAAVALDKDKLRRYCYINAGFPYGIPYENASPEALHWRERVANGWRVLRCFYLISRDVYAKRYREDERDRSKVFVRRVSGGVRSSRIWQTVSCPYQACDEHGIGHLFSRRRRSTGHCGDEEKVESEGDVIEEVLRRESLVLKKRLKYLKTLSEQDLLDYTYVWRLLFWVFRPYRRPGTSVMDCVQGWTNGVPHLAPWKAEISSISQGCSWLIWFVLHVGTTPFWRQWNPIRPNQNHVKDLLWGIWKQRSHHQIEIEREYICKFEFALRKRCLGSERAKRLESEILKGRTVKTISLECIQWEYDQHSIIQRPPADFPWYQAGERVWMDRNLWLRIGGGMMDLKLFVSRRSMDGGSRDEDKKGRLGRVPYLVYLGVENEWEAWGSTDLTTTGDMVW